MRVLLTGSFNAQILARQLRYYDIEAYVVEPWKLIGTTVFRGSDVFYLVYFSLPMALVSFSRSLSKKCVVHFVGSDAFYYASHSGFRKTMSSFALKSYDQVLYVTEELRRLVRLRGDVVPIPIDTRMFRPEEHDGEKRDILYYCAHPHEIYRVDWIIEYAKSHPEKTITVVGYDHLLNLPNVKTVPYVAYDQMPKIYNWHRCLIRMTTEDGYPKMPYEALLCGLKVFWNGQEITRVPDEMLMENTIPKLTSILESVKSGGKK